jgi:hypothetical protein
MRCVVAVARKTQSDAEAATGDQNNGGEGRDDDAVPASTYTGTHHVHRVRSRRNGEPVIGE